MTLTFCELRRARADAVVNAASADHEPSAQAMLQALEGTGKTFIHTSGSSIVGTQSAGERVDAVFDEDTPITPSSGRAARVVIVGRHPKTFTFPNLEAHKREVRFAPMNGHCQRERAPHPVT